MKTVAQWDQRKPSKEAIKRTKGWSKYHDGTINKDYTQVTKILSSFTIKEIEEAFEQSNKSEDNSIKFIFNDDSKVRKDMEQLRKNAAKSFKLNSGREANIHDTYRYNGDGDDSGDYADAAITLFQMLSRWLKQGAKGLDAYRKFLTTPEPNHYLTTKEKKLTRSKLPGYGQEFIENSAYEGNGSRLYDHFLRIQREFAHHIQDSTNNFGTKKQE